MGSFLSGCPVRGTDEAAEFKSCLATQTVNFAILKQEVLTPFRCLECHRDFNQESGLSAFVKPGESRSSRLFEVVDRALMPQGGPKLSDCNVSIIAKYIDGLTGTPTPTPLPKLEPTWTSLSKNLFEQSCHHCHGMNDTPPGRRINLSLMDVVKEHHQEIVDRLETKDEDEVMPPPKKNRPKPTEETIQAFKDWIRLGFPER